MLQNYKYIVLLILLLNSCKKKFTNEGTSLTVTIPAHIIENATIYDSAVSDHSLSRDKSILQESIAFETDDFYDSNKEVLIFYLAVTGKDTLQSTTVTRDFLLEQNENIKSKGVIEFHFRKLPRYTSLNLHLSVVLFSTSDPVTYPQGSYVFYKDNKQLSLNQNNTVVNLNPNREPELPMIRMASYIGELYNCHKYSGKELCSFRPYSRAELELSLCDKLTEFELNNPHLLFHHNFSKTLFLSTDNGGRLNTLLFPGEPLTLTLRGQTRSTKLIQCYEHIPIPPSPTSSHVWVRHIVTTKDHSQVSLMTTEELWNVLKPEARFELFPGHAKSHLSPPYYSSWNGRTKDLDLDGIADSIEINELHSSPLEADQFFTQNLQNQNIWIGPQNLIKEINHKTGFQFWLEGNFDNNIQDYGKEDELIQACMKIKKANSKYESWQNISIGSCSIFKYKTSCEKYNCSWDENKKNCKAISGYYFFIPETKQTLYKISFTNSSCFLLTQETCQQDASCSWNNDFQLCETACHKISDKCSKQDNCNYPATCNLINGCMYDKNSNKCLHICKHITEPMTHYIYVPKCMDENCWDDESTLKTHDNKVPSNSIY